MPTSLATSHHSAAAGVSYPTPRASASAMLQQQQKQHRVFHGVVTKLHDNFGFVDEDIFFQTRSFQHFAVYYLAAVMDCIMGLTCLPVIRMDYGLLIENK